MALILEHILQQGRNPDFVIDYEDDGHDPSSCAPSGPLASMTQLFPGAAQSLT